MLEKELINKYFGDKIGKGDFYTWDGFGVLLEWAKKQDWWKKFMERKFIYGDIMIDYINPEKFAQHIYEYLVFWNINK